MSTVKLYLEFKGRECVVTCDYQPPESQTMLDPAVDEELTITDVERDGECLLRDITAPEIAELDELAHEKFAEFMEAERIAKQERDSSPNPFGGWI